MKTITFPPGVHLIALEDNTTPGDFLAAFQYENRHLEHITPSVSALRKLDLSKNPCPIVLLPHQNEDCGRFIDCLYELSTLYSATFFVFFSDSPEISLEAQKSFTTILTYDKSTNGGIVKKGSGTMPIGPYTIEPPPVAIVDTPRETPAEAPSPKPTETVTKIKDLVKTSRGFHQAGITESHADAMLRGQKTDFICSAGCNVQKGDYLVFSVYNKQFHDISEIVWEVTFVSAVANSERQDGYGAVVLSLHRLPNTRFKKGDVGGEYLADCIVFSNP